MRLWLALALTASGLLPWLWLLRLPADTPRAKAMGLAVMLPVAALIVALLAPAPVHRTSQGSIALGLLLVVVAAALIQSRLLPAYSGYAHLLVAYVLYGVALALAAGGVRLTPWLLIPLLLAAAWAYRLYQRLGELWGTLMIAGALLLLALWAALSWAVAAASLSGGFLALVGMALLVLIHAAQVVGQYAPVRAGWGPPDFVYSLPAHLLIAWAVWG